MVKTIAEAIQAFAKRNPQGIPAIVIPAGDALVVDLNTVAVWTDRVTVPLVVEINTAIAIVYGGIPVKQDDDDDE